MPHYTLVKQVATGHVFIETPDRLWDQRLQAHWNNAAQPAPMPEGHLMFDNPASCGCEPVVENRNEDQPRLF